MLCQSNSGPVAGLSEIYVAKPAVAMSILYHNRWSVLLSTSKTYTSDKFYDPGIVNVENCLFKSYYPMAVCEIQSYGSEDTQFLRL